MSSTPIHTFLPFLQIKVPWSFSLLREYFVEQVSLYKSLNFPDKNQNLAQKHKFRVMLSPCAAVHKSFTSVFSAAECLRWRDKRGAFETSHRREAPLEIHHTHSERKWVLAKLYFALAQRAKMCVYSQTESTFGCVRVLTKQLAKGWPCFNHETRAQIYRFALQSWMWSDPPARPSCPSFSSTVDETEQAGDAREWIYTTQSGTDTFIFVLGSFK